MIFIFNKTRYIMTLSIAIAIMSVVHISIQCHNNDNIIVMITTLIKVIITIVILVIIVMIMMTTMIIIIIVIMIVIIYSDNSQIVMIVIQSWYIIIIIMVYHANHTKCNTKCTITITQKNMTYVLKISPHLYLNIYLGKL